MLCCPQGSEPGMGSQRSYISAGSMRAAGSIRLYNGHEKNLKWHLFRDDSKHARSF